MGSGSGGNYSGTGGGSQPYADTYKVVADQLQNDKKDPDIYNSSSGYFKNPTAVSLEDSVSGNRIEFEGHRAEGKMTYVMAEDGTIILESDQTQTMGASEHRILLSLEGKILKSNAQE